MSRDTLYVGALMVLCTLIALGAVEWNMFMALLVLAQLLQSVGHLCALSSVAQHKLHKRRPPVANVPLDPIAPDRLRQQILGDPRGAPQNFPGAPQNFPFLPFLPCP
jgi:hypothetical protein